jgi:hypothetical protein
MFSTEYPHPPQIQSVLHFLKNGIEYLTLGDALIQIRAKKTASPFIENQLTPKEKAERKAKTLWMAPSLLLLIGLWRFLLRFFSRRPQKLQKKS